LQPRSSLLRDLHQGADADAEENRSSWLRMQYNFGQFCEGLLNRFFRSSQPAFAQLGPLEQRLMQEIWARGHATVRELLRSGNLSIAYTTVMTTLDRLYKKQLLTRVAEGRAFRYSPKVSQEEMHRAAAGDAIRQLLQSSDAATLPLSYLVEAVSEHDVELLDELQRMVEKKRRELRKGETP
jgi:predicted transcriptional regulator